MLEDRDDDAILVERELRRAGIVFTAARAVDRAGFLAALREFTPDLILSDHSLGGFTGIEALDLAADIAATVPFIFVSGTIGEEAAIEALRRGATDYVIKDRLSRLVPVVQRALRETATRREHAQLEKEFLQAQKMESLGRMAGSIAHDFNNLLLVVAGNAELLVRSGMDPATARAKAEAIHKAAQRGQELTSRLLAFSRNEPVETSDFDLNRQLREFGPVIASLLGKGVIFEAAYHPDALPLRGAPSQIDQVLMNLLVNARDAMPAGGTVTLTTARLDSPAGPPPGFPLAPPGSYAVMSVRDSGSGMTPEVRARAFEPFFTTKGAGQGTGLGLATVYGIVKQFGGAVQVDSEPGRGCEFRLLFRLAGVGGGARSASRAVLLVDDDDGVRAYTRHVLEMASCAVEEAAGGAAALARLEREPAAWAMLVTDVMMPGVDGVAVARRARELRPDLPIVFVSGVAAALEQAGAAVPDAVLVAKPFSPAELIRTVRLAQAA